MWDRSTLPNMVVYRVSSAHDADVIALEARMQAEYVEMYGEPDQDPDNDYRTCHGLRTAYDGERAVGLIGWKAWEDGDGKVCLLWVDPEYRGQRIADHLLLVVETAAALYGCRYMRFETGPKQLSAQRLYERNGYAKSRQGFGFYADNPGSVFYRKALSMIEGWTGP